MERLTVALELREEKQPRYWLLLGKLKHLGFLRPDEKKEFETLQKELADLSKEIMDLTR